MSFNITYKAYTQLKDRFKLLAENNIIVIAAAGDNDDLIQTNIFYPAMDSNVISVGDINEKFTKHETDAFCSRLDYIFAIPEILSCYPMDRGGYGYLSGCSMSTAFVTGIVALIVSSFKKQNKIISLNSIKEELSNISLNFLENKIDNYTLLKP